MLAVMTILLLIYGSNMFVRILSKFDASTLQFETIAQMLSLEMVSALTILLQLALFLGVLLAFSRLHKDNEIVVLEACGVSPRTGLRVVMSLAVLVAVLVALLSLWIAPWAEEQSYQARDRQSSSSELAGLISGRFMELRGVDGVLYVEQIADDGISMRNVFIQSVMPGQQQRQLILVAQSGQQQRDRQSGESFLVLDNGYRYEGTPGERDYRIIEFRHHSMRIKESPVSHSFRRHRARSTMSLLAMKESEDMAELQWRLSMPVAVMLLAMLAVPLSRSGPRQGQYSRLFIAVLIYVIYNNLLSVSYTWVDHGSSMFGLWWVHLVLAALIWWLLARQYGYSWLLQALRLKRVR
jgi:lipopolysaccharide export system permease protein